MASVELAFDSLARLTEPSYSAARIQPKAESAAKARDGPAPVPSQWTTEVRLEAGFEGGRSYHAQVFRDRLCLCHIILAGVSIEAAKADELVAIRVRNWIESFETRGSGELQASSSHDEGVCLTALAIPPQGKTL